MAEISAKISIWGWFFFDWASQPYNTLILTFIFGPYIKTLIGDPVEAQATWGFVTGFAGICIALAAPILGAIADNSGNRMRWIWVFSIMYVIGAFGIWYAAPGMESLTWIFVLFGIGLIGMEFATIFTNSMLPDLGTREEIGKISGNGWAFGYVGGLLALIVMLTLFAESPEGKTLIGIKPLLGLDAAAREGTRFVGPLTALWFIVFMVPFFLWVRDPKHTNPDPLVIRHALGELWGTIKGLPKSPGLFAYLGSSMFYRDALNGIYIFGGLYTAGVLGWSATQTGVFGIIAITTGAVFAWLGGKADATYGPKPVITVCITVLTLVVLCFVFISRDSVFGIAVGSDSKLPDIAFYVLGAVIGAGGGALQSASRTMMVRQANPGRMTEAFGLYALAGKATSFIAPISIGVVTASTGSQQLGVIPLIVLFALGLVLLRWVHPNGQAGSS
jgi:UMF1 family MFS transporter